MSINEEDEDFSSDEPLSALPAGNDDTTMSPVSAGGYSTLTPHGVSPLGAGAVARFAGLQGMGMMSGMM